MIIKKSFLMTLAMALLPLASVCVSAFTINNVDLRLVSGSKVIIKNGGKINLASGKELVAPVGAIIEITEGSIQ